MGCKCHNKIFFYKIIMITILILAVFIGSKSKGIRAVATGVQGGTVPP